MSLMLFTHYLFGYVGTAICLIGLVLALCSVYIFTRRQMRSAVSTYLTGLSISDSCLLFLGLIFAINSSIPPKQQAESFYSSRLHKQMFPYIYACIIWFQFTSVWVTIGFAIDRWFAIKWPMLHYTYSSKRACYIVVMIYAFGLIYSLPRFFEYKTEVQREKFTVIGVLENYTESIDYLVIINRLHNSSLYQYSVHLISYSLFQSILPLLMLSYFNVELIRSINASSHFLQRCTTAYGQAAETNTIRCRDGIITRSVICLIALFTLCQVPASILNYIYMYHRNHPLLYICYDISNFLILLNSAVNFFIFTLFNRKFRRELTRICCHSKARATFFLRTSSQPSLKRTSSHIRLPLTNIFDHLPSNYWEYVERTGHSRFNRRSIDDMQKKSIDSEYHPQSVYHHTRPLISRRTLNNNYHSISRQGRRKLSSSSSITSRTSHHHMGKPLHYVACRRDPLYQRQRQIVKQLQCLPTPSTTTSISHVRRSIIPIHSDTPVLNERKKSVQILAHRSYRE